MSASCLDRPSLALDSSLSLAAKGVYLAAVEWIEVEDLEATYARLCEATGLHGSSLQRAVRELEERHLLQRHRCGGEMAVRLVTGDWSSPVVVVASEVVEEEEQQQQKAPANTRSPVTSEASVDPLLSELLELGVAARRAAELVAEYAAPRILEVLEAVRAKLSKLSNPAGWVIAALQEAWSFACRPATPSPSSCPHQAHGPHQGPHKPTSNRTDPRPEEKARIDRERDIEREVDRLERGLSEDQRKVLEAEAEREIPEELREQLAAGLHSLKSLVRTGVRKKLRATVAIQSPGMNSSQVARR